ncbi:S26 family signal peptidase [Haloprofundus salinisoli]|uniref:S26 family signal peptidase n=1 Tax=Haloprofundus salinisoli TaxID=2876193 RepID=UPI001CC9607C|nr:S26 family signal peptidase [Haloprofundus salinisoli]
MSGTEGGSVVREFFGILAAIFVVSAVLFAVAGVWPPVVAVESASMQPNLDRGDLVFVTDVGRFGGDGIDGDGITTVEEAESTAHERFGRPGDVVVFEEPDRYGAPTLHRAHLWVEAGENWYDRADPAAIPAEADSCEELANCPAPHAGFVTKGDGNQYYDQATGYAEPVRPGRIRAKADVGVPMLGWLRLLVTGVL